MRSKIYELINENEKLNAIKNEFEEKINDLNNELKEYKNKIENEYNDDESNKGYNRLISVTNIKISEDKENNEVRRLSNFDFFEKKQSTGKFGGVEEEEISNNKNLLNENINEKRSAFEEKENRENRD